MKIETQKRIIHTIIEDLKITNTTPKLIGEYSEFLNKLQKWRD